MIGTTHPQFKSEAEEAEWWDEHREETAEWMEDAAASGQTTTLPDLLERARRRSTEPRIVPIGIDPDDIVWAHSLAVKKGLPYQIYLKMLFTRPCNAMSSWDEAIAQVGAFDRKRGSVWHPGPGVLGTAARHGSTRHLWAAEALTAAINYVATQQGEPIAVGLCAPYATP